MLHDIAYYSNINQVHKDVPNELPIGDLSINYILTI